MITPVFSAAHVSRWENRDHISNDDHRPRRKRTRLSDGEDQTDVDVDVDVDVEYETSPAPRRVKPLPAHVHGYRQQSDGELPPTQISTKESSHGQYIPTCRSLGACKSRPSYIPPRTLRFCKDGGKDAYLGYSLVCPYRACHLLGRGILFHAVRGILAHVPYSLINGVKSTIHAWGRPPLDLETV